MTNTSIPPIRLLGRDFVGFVDAFGAQAATWTGGDAHGEWVDLPTLESQLLTQGRARSGDVDLVLVVSDWLPHLIENGDLLRLDDLLADNPPADWPQGWSPSMRTLTRARDGSTHALAYHDGPMLTLYRGDLYEDANEQEGFRALHGYALRPPQTWAEYVDQAEWFARPEEGLWGTVLAGLPDGHNTVYDFLLQLWNRGGALSRDGDVAFDGAEGIAALTFLDRLWNDLGVIDPQARRYDSVASGQAFADGRAALMVNWCGFAALSSLPGSPTAGLVRCAPVPRVELSSPRSVSVNVFWAVGVASGSRDPVAAYDLVRHLASPEMDKITSRAGATGTRLSTWRDPAIQAIAPYYSIIEEVHRSVDSPPATAAWPQIAGALTAMVDGVLHRRKSPHDAAADAANVVRDAGWLDKLR